MKLASLLLVFLTSLCYGQERLDGTYESDKKLFRLKNGHGLPFYGMHVAPYSDGATSLMGLIYTTGLVVMKPRYYEIEHFGNGLARVTQKAEPWELTYGFIDTTGKEILPPIYTDADQWYDRSMRLADVLVVGLNGQYGLFDYAGKQLCPLQYQSIWNFREGRARVYQNGKVGFINKQGKEVIATQYEKAEDFMLHMALVKNEGKYGWIDTTGKVLIPLEYEWAANFRNGSAKVKKDGKMFLIDRQGQRQLSTDYESFGHFKNGLAWAQKDGKWGFIDTLGKVVIPMIYKKTGDFEHGRVWVWKDDKWGHIDTTGAIITPIIYEQAGNFSRGYSDDSLFASVMLNGKYGKVNLHGKLVIPCEYIGIDHYSMGMAKVKKQVGDSAKYGFVNYFGEEVIPCIYDKAERFQRGSKLTIVAKDGKMGLINQEGKFITELKYISIHANRNGTFNVRDQSGFYLLDQEGKRVEK
ncbi:MAG: WG repeat-containing protein [Bacteroidetes bacterium]|nr:MAG: WG repeat-containing protein [Bacteroidota bacterium]